MLITSGKSLTVRRTLDREYFMPDVLIAAIARGSGGTHVPGMGRTLALNPYVLDDAGIDHLGGLGISSDAADY